MDLDKYKQIFTQESQKYLKELDDFLLAVEKDLGNTDLWREIHGKIHSIKGMARALSLEPVTELAHAMEDWCQAFQNAQVAATAETLQFLFHAGELLRHLVLETGVIIADGDQQAFERIMAQLRKGPEEFEIATLTEEPQLDASAEKINSVQVRYEIIEELLGLSQEIMLHEKELSPLARAQMTGGLKAWIDHYTPMLKGIHFRLAQLRLMAVDDFADLFTKTIRNLARENNKDVDFTVIGGEIQADITILERIREPFIHILRNSIIHGIEDPTRRAAAGKKPQGCITLTCTREKNHLFLKISDDGRGIDRDFITNYLKEKKGLSAEAIKRMAAEEFYDTILNVDFSSAAQVTDMSGRGVGMHVVAQAIEYLGGKIWIASEPSQGTDILFILPLSLSIIHAVSFKLDRYTLSIPTHTVMSIDRQAPTADGGHRNCDLHRLLAIQGPISPPLFTLKLKAYGQTDSTAAAQEEVHIGSDAIIGNHPLMVLPVDEILAKLKIFAGVGVMESGDLSLLLDIKHLMA